MNPDSCLARKYTKSIKQLRNRINMIAPKYDQNGYALTIVCPVSNGALELTESILTRGLIYIDEEDGGYIIKIVFEHGLISLVDTLSRISGGTVVQIHTKNYRSLWLNPDSKEYHIIVAYVENFIQECIGISEFEIYPNINRSPLQPLISHSNPSVYFDK